MASGSGKPNRLVFASSPYLRQHAQNPVDWYPWCQEAFDKAREEDKPIFLSIGYATCHWCHVMARESFSDPDVARFLNDHFVAIKVDRQEHPQVDEFYMRAALTMHRQGGWPLSVFCTPEGLPFFAGTYFPPEPRYGLPSFRQVLEVVHEHWQKERENLQQLGQHIAASLVAPPAKAGELDLSALEEQALRRMEEEFDPEYGGFGDAPKFPLHARLFFLLELGRRGNRKAATMLARTLEGMAQGGIRDPLFGGFHRYATDRAWFIPHYEKMLSDNALLADLYLEAGRRFGVARWRQIGRQTLRFLLSLWRATDTPDAWAPVDFAVLKHAYLAAGCDAESQGEEGRPYTFTLEELQNALTPEELSVVIRSSPFPWGTGERRPLALRPWDRARGAELGLPSGAGRLLAKALARLRRHAKAKGLPELDDQAVSGWIAMALVAYTRWLAFARAGDSHLETGVPHLRKEERDGVRSPGLFAMRKLLAFSDYAPPHLLPLELAEAIWQFGWSTNLTVPRTVFRGRPNTPETLEDLAWFVTACLEIFLATGATWWLRRATEVLHQRVPRYLGRHGELFSAPDDPRLVPQQRVSYDHAYPSPGAVLCRALYRCWWLTGVPRYRHWADQALQCEAEAITANPHNAASWLLAAREGQALSMLVVAGDPLWPSTKALLRTAQRHRHRPDLVLYLSHWPPTEDDLELLPVLRERPAVGETVASAYLCTGTQCWPAVSDPDQLARLFRQVARADR